MAVLDFLSNDGRKFYFSYLLTWAFMSWLFIDDLMQTDEKNVLRQNEGQWITYYGTMTNHFMDQRFIPKDHENVSKEKRNMLASLNEMVADNVTYGWRIHLQDLQEKITAKLSKPGVMRWKYQLVCMTLAQIIDLFHTEINSIKHHEYYFAQYQSGLAFIIPLEKSLNAEIRQYPILTDMKGDAVDLQESTAVLVQHWKQTYDDLVSRF